MTTHVTASTSIREGFDLPKRIPGWVRDAGARSWHAQAATELAVKGMGAMGGIKVAGLTWRALLQTDAPKAEIVQPGRREARTPGSTGATTCTSSSRKYSGN